MLKKKKMNRTIGWEIKQAKKKKKKKETQPTKQNLISCCEQEMKLPTYIIYGH